MASKKLTTVTCLIVSEEGMSIQQVTKPPPAELGDHKCRGRRFKRVVDDSLPLYEEDGMKWPETEKEK